MTIVTERICTSSCVAKWRAPFVSTVHYCDFTYPRRLVGVHVEFAVGPLELRQDDGGKSEDPADRELLERHDAGREKLQFRSIKNQLNTIFVSPTMIWYAQCTENIVGRYRSNIVSIAYQFHVDDGRFPVKHCRISKL